MEQIYYVENDENDVFLLKRALQKVGLRDAIRHFFSGVAFKQAVKEIADLPRLFLFDLKLDGESGLDLLKWVKEQEGLTMVPAVIFSSGTVPQEMVESMSLNANAYMFKPAGGETWREVAEQIALIAGLLELNDRSS